MEHDFCLACVNVVKFNQVCVNGGNDNDSHKETLCIDLIFDIRMMYCWWILHLTKPF